MYLWVKAFHIIAVIAWMAGMLYLPRLFVYHAAAAVGSPQAETFKVMERRLLRYIMTPALVAAWLLGIWLALDGHFLGAGWFHGKLALVLAMTALHGLFARWTGCFERDRNPHSQKFYRIINEVVTVLLVLIVILVTVKPF
jgi:putative membrane protein